MPRPSAILLSLLLAAPCAPQTAPRPIEVAVDPRIELLAIVQYLSGYPACPGLLTRFDLAYKRAVDAAFAGHRGDRAVQLFAELSAKGFAFDGPVAALLHYGPPPALATLCDVDPAIAA